jgi:peptide/nickel transport system substrate-binding protein
MDSERTLTELLRQRLSRRDLLRNAGAAGIGLAALQDLAWPAAASATTLAQATGTPAATPKIGAQLIGKLEGPTTITDPAKFPKTFKEAPQLAELVKAGKLPPVAERIGADPLVIKPVHEIGRYGGTIRRGFTGPGDWSAGVRFCGNDSLVHWDMTGTKPTPLAIKSWKFSDGDKTLTIQLRRGMKWSDGAPFTADDFMFWFEALYKNKDLVPAPSPYLTTKSGPAELEKVDTYAVRWRFKDPYWVFVSILTGPTGLGGQAHDSHVSALGGYAPAHYLKQFLQGRAGQEGQGWQVRQLGQPAQVQGRLGTEPGTAGDLTMADDAGQKHRHLGAGAQPLLLRGRHRRQSAPLHRQGGAHPRGEPRGHQLAGHRRGI